MSEKVGEIYVELEARRDKFTRDLNAAEMQSKNFGKRLDSTMGGVRNSFAKIGPVVAVAAAAVAAMYVKMTKLAIDATETQQKFNVTFQDTIDEANAAATALAEGYGLARDEAQSLLANTGDLLSGFGMTGREALNLSNQVQMLAADLASFSNFAGGTRGASEALTKALLGERESIKALGIVIRETDVQQRIAQMGMAGATGQARLQAQAQATLALAMEQSQNAIGDFARSATSPANVIRRIQARMRDIGVEIGGTLLPGLKDLGKAFIEASKDGGVLMTAAKAIGTIMGKIGTSIAILVNMLTLFNRTASENRAALAMDRYASASSAAAQQQQALIGQAHQMGLITTKSAEDGRRQLEALAAQTGTNATAAQRLVERLREYDAEISNNHARSRDARAEWDRAQSSLEGIRTELDRNARSLVGMSSETENAIRAREAERRATQGNTVATEAQRKALEKLRQTAARWYEQVETAGMSASERQDAEFQNNINTLHNYMQQRLLTTQQASQAEAAIIQQYEEQKFQARLQYAQQGLSQIGGIVGQIGALFAQAAQNETTKLSQEQNSQKKILDKKYQDDKKRILTEIKDKDKQEKALAELDEKYAAQKEAIDAAYEAKKRKVQYEAAKRQKAISIVQAIINTAQAVTRALAEGGPFGGPALAAVMGALGAAQIALIAQQPLPELASGGFFSGPAIIGERGREFAFPIDSAQGQRAMGYLADKLLDSAARKAEATSVEPSASIDFGTNETGDINLTIQFADEIWQEKISAGTKNRTIRIDRGALVG